MTANIVHTAWIGLGSNLGDRKDNLERARRSLEKSGNLIKATSSVYRSPPWGFESSNHFFNQCIVIETRLMPAKLLALLKQTEKVYGRDLDGNGYTDRVIDLDILFIDDLIISEDQLEVPHPRIAQRLFVLKPLHEISPAKMHPVLKRTVSELLATCSDRSNVERLPAE